MLWPDYSVTTKGTQEQRQVKLRIYCPQNELRQSAVRKPDQAYAEMENNSGETGTYK